MKAKRGKYSSNVPLARAHIEMAIRECQMDAQARRLCGAALVLMRRAPFVRMAPVKQTPITPAQKRAVMALKHSDLTSHEIANRVGLASAGRVSEILNGLR